MTGNDNNIGSREWAKEVMIVWDLMGLKKGSQCSSQKAAFCLIVQQGGGGPLIAYKSVMALLPTWFIPPVNILPINLWSAS